MPGKRKTDTIKQRTVYVYLPEEDIKAEWEAEAKKVGMSLSKWIYWFIEDRRNKLGVFVTNRETGLEEDVMGLRNELDEANSRIELLNKVKDKQEKELRKFRAQTFTDPNHLGFLPYDEQLLQLFRSTLGRNGEYKTVTEEEILKHLGVKPDEEEAMKLLHVQLSHFESYDLIEYTKGGWRWKG